MKSRRKNTTRTNTTIWDRCSVCVNQMFGGERCLVHNPTPELRAALAYLTVLSWCTTPGGSVKDERVSGGVQVGRSPYVTSV